jgi:hypothetical protein
MALTLERDGVFRASVYDKTDWYIVDPSVEGGIDGAREAFFQRVGATNRGEWDRVARATVFLVVALLVGGGIAYLSNLIPGIDIWRGLIYFGAALLGLLLGGLATIPVFPLPEINATDGGAVLPIPEHIAEWAEDNLTASELWNLVKLQRRLGEVRRLANHLLEDWDFEHRGERPDNVIGSLVLPVLYEEFEERREEFRRVSAELGFTPRPEDVRDILGVE